MKLQTVLLGVSLLTFGWAWTQRSAPDSAIDYRFEFDRASEGLVSVRAALAVDADQIVLRPLLAEGIFELDALEARDENSGVLPVSLLATKTEHGDSSRSFTRIVIQTRGAREVALYYDVRPSVYLPPSGDREERQLGRVRENGCVLSLANLVVLPEDAITELHLEPVLPPNWIPLVELPLVANTGERAALWEAALVAGEYSGAATRLTQDVRAHFPREVGAEVAPTVKRLVEALEDVLGPPREHLEIIVAPHVPGSAPVELPGAVRAVVTDVKGVDPGSLRRFVMRVVPAWWGRTTLDIELDDGSDAWFALGVREYLAHRLPSDAGLLGRDPVVGIESSWVSQPMLQPLDLRLGPDGSGITQYSRRFISLTLLHELDRSLGGGLLEQLRDFDGYGFPQPLATGVAAETFQRFVDVYIEQGQRELSFESDWSITWDPSPIERGVRTPIARAVSIAFTSDTAGFLETCGCKAAQSGGVARRAAVLGRWRKDDPGLVLIDLGNFSAAGGDRVALDPILSEEQALYDSLFEVSAYDAVVLGPDEFYTARASSLTSSTDQAVPRLSGGIRSHGEEWGPNVTIVERAGLKIGIVGYSELHENAHIRQAQEANLAGIAFPESPADVEETLRELRPRVDLLVVAGRMRPATLRAFADEGLDVDVVLSAGHFSMTETQGGPSGFLGTTLVALDQLNRFGLQRLTVFLSKEGKVVSSTNEHVKLGEDVPDDPEMRARLDEFYATSDVARLPIQPLFHEDPLHSAGYVGSRTCGTCHTSEYSTWQGTRHASALETLTEVRRDRSPKCVQCHVVGLGTGTGYSLAKPDPALAGVGCENCHGAGEQHVLAPTRDNIRLTPERSTCLTCHNAKHSDMFEGRFDEAWAHISHR